MRYLLPLLLLLHCQPTEPTPAREVQALTGLLRYEQRDSTLEGQLTLHDSIAEVPELQGKPMEAVAGMHGRRFHLKTERDFPPEVRFTIPNEGDTVDLILRLDPVTIDSLPPEVYRDSTLSLRVGQRGLLDNESLVVAFIPPNGGIDDRRVLIPGPTPGGEITLWPETLDDIPPGEYRVYLFKQQLYRDRLEYLRASIRIEYVSHAATTLVR